MNKLLLKQGKHKALFEFSIYAEKVVPVIIKNALLLKEHIPQNIKNPVLVFLLSRGINGALEKLILEIEQAGRVLNDVLEDLGKKPESEADYKDLQRMRNKLIGHFVDASLSGEGDRHLKWYKQKYGTYEKTFDLVQRVAKKINNKVNELRDEGVLIIGNGQIGIPNTISVNDIEKLLNALRKEGIY